MPHRSAAILSAICLLLAAAVVVLWLRSYWTDDQLGYLRRTTTNGRFIENRWGLFSSRGRLAAGFGDMNWDEAWTADWTEAQVANVTRFGWHTDRSGHVYAEFDDWFLLGFAMESGHGLFAVDGQSHTRGSFISVPHWFLAILLLLFPLWRLLILTGRYSRSPKFLLGAEAMLIAAGISLCFPDLFYRLVPSVLSVFGPAVLLTSGAVALILCGIRWPSRAARRIAAGLCPICAYDLRASQDRCPECGTPVPADLVRRPIV